MGSRRRMMLGGVAAGAAVSLAASVWSSRGAFEARIARDVDELFASRAESPDETVSEANLANLPEPVRRWLRWSGVVGRERPHTVRLRQEGELLLGGTWRPFTAEEYYTTEPPGFVWSVRMPIWRGVAVIGRDRYADGKGSIDMRLLGIVILARDRGPEMDHGALLRYLNEIMWFPAGAISPYITWEEIDGASARATMRFGGVSASTVFMFDRDGRVTDMVAERHDRESGQVLPWSTPITEYGEFDGIRIPIAGEAVYARSSGDEPYIRLRITGVEYNIPKRFGAP